MYREKRFHYGFFKNSVFIFPTVTITINRPEYMEENLSISIHILTFCCEWFFLGKKVK